MDKYNFQVRVTGILLENDTILLVKQKISKERNWSLPGGRAEEGEQLEEAIIREMLEETGLTTKVKKLLYLCEKIDCTPPIVHITFLLERVDGNITLPTNEFDKNPIKDVKFVSFTRLAELGFTQKFVEILKNNFPDSGSYMGLKKNIGL